MYWAASGALALLHLLRIAWTVLVALLYYPFVPNPMPLDASRSKTPQNLALVLSETSSDPTEEEVNAIMDSVVHAVAWCEAVGVTSLCVYDQHGTSKRLGRRIEKRLRLSTPKESTASEEESDGSDSEHSSSFSVSSLSSLDSCCSLPPIVTLDLNAGLGSTHCLDCPSKRPGLVKRRMKGRVGPAPRLSVYLASYDASKPLMAFLAQSSAKSMKEDGSSISNITVAKVDGWVKAALQSEPPDLMVVHPVKQYALLCPPVELFGFPPWFLMLTEIYYDSRPSIARAWKNRAGKQNFVPLSEETFRSALDSFTQAEMRFGK